MSGNYFSGDGVVKIFVRLWNYKDTSQARSFAMEFLRWVALMLAGCHVAEAGDFETVRADVEGKIFSVIKHNMPLLYCPGRQPQKQKTTTYSGSLAKFSLILVCRYFFARTILA
jgi:hypothetical protein